MENILPVILYDIDGELIKSKEFTTTKSNIYFYSYQNFNVEIIDGDGNLYSVLEKTVAGSFNESFNKSFGGSNKKTLDITKNKVFDNLDNFGYTLIFDDNNTTINLKITSYSGFVDVYTIHFVLENTETDKTPLYNDLLINNYLPNLDDILPALNPDSNKAEIIKRLLLDFKDIVRYKGTIDCIDKFFSMMGYVDEQIRVFPEYTTPNNTQTLTPNKLVDVKNGNYHIVYDNWDSEELNNCNLPYRPFSTENFDLLFESLKYAIPLANKYFTSNEQNIIFFGVNLSSNISRNKNLLGSINQIFVNDVYDFRKNVNINMYSYSTISDIKIVKNELIQNKNQISKDTYLTEIKYIKTNQKENDSLFFVESEIFDNDIFSNTIENYHTDFGILNHLDIIVDNKYLEIFIEDGVNKINYDKTFVNYLVNLKFVINKAIDYKITINIYDEYNNRESYVYEFKSTINNKVVDIETFTTKNLMLQNDITVDVTSDSVVSENKLLTFENYVLNIDSVPEDLSEYYNVGGNIDNWLGGYDEEYTPINEYKSINSLTKNIPLKYIDQTFEYLLIPKNQTFQLWVYDKNDCVKKPIEYNDLKIYDNNWDNIYVGKLMVEDEEYIFISFNETGLSFNKNSFDFRWENGESIYETIKSNTINIHLDFNLTDKNETIYASNGLTTIHSIYTKMLLDKVPNNIVFGIGDILICRLNNNYVTKISDIKWWVFDSFSKEEIYYTENYILKYTINNNSIYDIRCEFVVNNEKIVIEKNSLLTSFGI